MTSSSTTTTTKRPLHETHPNLSIAWDLIKWVILMGLILFMYTSCGYVSNPANQPIF